MSVTRNKQIVEINEWFEKHGLKPILNVEKKTRIKITGSPINTFPPHIQLFSNLKELILSDNKITSVPESIGDLKKLKKLSIYTNEITSIPKSIGDLTKLESFVFDENKITSIPKSIGNLKNLTSLEFNETLITSIPESIGDLKNLKRLFCYGNKITSIPESIGDLTKLEILNISTNIITKIPESIGNLKNLKRLSCYENKITSLPESIGKLVKLESLMINDNKIKKLPKSIGNLQNLELITNDNELDNQFIKLKQERKMGVKLIEKSYLLKKHPLTEGQYIRRLRKKENWATEWQEMCRHLNKDYKLDELKEIASSLHLNVNNKSKREVCALLAIDFDSFQKKEGSKHIDVVKERGCTNPSSFIDGVEYDTIQDIELIEFEENGKKYCFTLEELDGLKKGSQDPKNPKRWRKPLNPYTNVKLQHHIWSELKKKQKAIKKKGDNKHKIHTLNLVFIDPEEKDKQDLKKIFDEFHKSHAYIRYDELLNLSKGNVKKLDLYLREKIGLRYSESIFKSYYVHGFKKAYLYLLNQMKQEIDKKAIGGTLNAFLEENE